MLPGSKERGSTTLLVAIMLGPERWFNRHYRRTRNDSATNGFQSLGKSLPENVTSVECWVSRLSSLVTRRGRKLPDAMCADVLGLLPVVHAA